MISARNRACQLRDLSALTLTSPSHPYVRAPLSPHHFARAAPCSLGMVVQAQSPAPLVPFVVPIEIGAFQVPPARVTEKFAVQLFRRTKMLQHPKATINKRIMMRQECLDT